jgi:hypothetical protein
MKGETAAGLNVIAQSKWLIDSDAALQKVRGEFKCKHVAAAQYRLLRAHSVGEASWLIEFFDDHDEVLVRFRIDARTGELHQLHADEE